MTNVTNSIAHWNWSGTKPMFWSLICRASPTSVNMIALLPSNEKPGLTAQSLPPWSPSKLAKERLAKRQSTFVCSMEVSAFVSIIWAFINFFIAIQPSFHDWRFYRSPDLISLKYATPMPGALREDVLLVTVMRDGVVFFRDQRVESYDLPDLIQTGLRQGSERKVYLRVSGRTRYGDLSPVLEEIRRTGVQVGFLSQ